MLSRTVVCIGAALQATLSIWHGVVLLSSRASLISLHRLTADSRRVAAAATLARALKLDHAS
jgi:hypothetical protein